eukprot:GILJ01015042.1.p1 GENE.GILJ01015042.1~~GILJ01015042.1.p1  ORF type:complete len:607 (+),score=109.37 GILJ01015042.1:3-1823(+)
MSQTEESCEVASLQSYNDLLQSVTKGKTRNSAQKSTPKDDTLSLETSSVQPTLLFSSPNTASAEESMTQPPGSASTQSQKFESRLNSAIFNSATPLSPLFSDVKRQDTSKTLESSPAVADLDVDRFASSLDDFTAKFKSEAMREFLVLKRQLLHDQIVAIQHEQKKCTLTVTEHENQIEGLKEALASAESTIRTLTRQVNSLAGMCGDAKIKHRISSTETKSLNGWMSYVNRNKHKRTLNRTAKGFAKTHVLRRMLNNWKKSASDLRKQKTETAWNSKVDHIVQQLKHHHAAQISELQSKLFQAEEAVKETMQSKKQLQDDLKQAFMRGVCALNFEAMSICNPRDGQSYQTTPGGSEMNFQPTAASEATDDRIPAESFGGDVGTDSQVVSKQEEDVSSFVYSLEDSGEPQPLNLSVQPSPLTGLDMTFGASKALNDNTQTGLKGPPPVIKVKAEMMEKLTKWKSAGKLGAPVSAPVDKQTARVTLNNPHNPNKENQDTVHSNSGRPQPVSLISSSVVKDQSVIAHVTDTHVTGGKSIDVRSASVVAKHTITTGLRNSPLTNQMPVGKSAAVAVKKSTTTTSPADPSVPAIHTNRVRSQPKIAKALG